MTITMQKVCPTISTRPTGAVVVAGYSQIHNTWFGHLGKLFVFSDKRFNQIDTAGAV